MKKIYTFLLVAAIGFLALAPTMASAQCSVTISSTNVTCFGLCNGRAIANPTGGVAPYTYSWSPSGGTSDTAKLLCAGTYTVNVTDAATCSTSTVVTITQPTALSLTMGPNSSTCSCTGSLMGAANGGTPLYSYSWTPSGGIGPGASNLCPGTYTLTVTDGNACMSSTTGVVTTSAPPAVAIVTQTNVNCGGNCNGKVTVSTSGGTSPYTYSWTGSSNTSTTDSSMCAGTYTVTAKDVNGCTGTNTITITQPPVLVGGITSQVNNLCGGQCRGKAYTTTSGGTAPYTYSWSTSRTTRDSATRLCTGSVAVTITDANGCSKTDSVSITGPAQPLTAATTQTNAKCHGGTGMATATASGGTAPYTYSWVPNPLYFALAAGPEICNITDSNGCTTTKFFNITQPSAIVPTVLVTPASSSTASDGKDSVSVTGGTGGTYTYSWSPNNCNTPSCSGLTAGYYTVCVTDSNNCKVCVTDTLGVTGIVEMEAPAMFIFPNPAGDFINIQIPAQYNIQSLELFNGMGELLFERKDFKANLLDLSGLAPGTYLLRLNFPGGSMHKFFIKE
jgi:hypothetical protein